MNNNMQKRQYTQKSSTRRIGLAALLTLAFGLASQPVFAQSPEQQAPPAPPVGFVVVKPQTLNLTENLPARLSAFRHAVVRARVTGIVEKRLFTEGSYVSAGQPLFVIDDRPFRAALAAAKAQLAQAEAAKKLNQANVNRYRRLLKSKAVSQQVYDQSQAQLAATLANIEAAKAAITQAELNIEYAKVTAPIDGYIGQAAVTEGALVSAAAATELAQIQQIDRLYVNIKQPAAQMIKLKQQLMQANQQQQTAEQLAVKVFFEDGTPYSQDAQLLFTDINVDPLTGEASLRAILPNPDGLLMPGLYLRVEVPQNRIDNAVLLPQQAVTRGKSDSVFVLNADNTFTPRGVKVIQSQGHYWLIGDGLNAGDKVIVDGMQKVLMMRLNTVTPVPWQAQSPQKTNNNQPNSNQ